MATIELDLNGVAAGEDYSTTFVPGGGAISLTSNGTIADSGGTVGQMRQIAVAVDPSSVWTSNDQLRVSGISNLTPGGSAVVVVPGSPGIQVTLSSDGKTLTFSPTSGSTASVTNFQTALNKVTFNNTSSSPQGDRIFAITATDDGGGSITNRTDAQISTVKVPSNMAPDAQADKTITLNEDAALTALSISAPTDPDNNPLTIKVTALPDATKGEVYLADGVTAVTSGQTLTSAQLQGLVYKPVADANGAAGTFIYSVSDGLLSDSQTITFNITPVNDAPVAQANTASGDEDTAITGAVKATDVDNASLTYSVVTQTQNGTLTFKADGTYTYQPKANFNGTDTFTYKASDGTADSAAQTVTITVTPVNDKPVAVADEVTTSEDTPLTIAAAELLKNDSDVDKDTLSVSAVTQGANGTVTKNTDGTLTYTPKPDFHGTDTFTYTVTDGQGNTSIATATVTVTVDAVNDAPVVATAIDDQSSAEDAAWSFLVPAGTFSDVDGDALTLSATLGDGTALPSWLKFDTATKTFSGTPPQDFNGAIELKVSASDGALSVSDTFKLTITPVNDKPVAVAANTVATDEDIPSSPVAIAASDADGDTLTYTVKAGAEPKLGSVSFADGKFTYVPKANANGTDTFTILISDSHGGNAEQVVTATIQAVNDAPTAEKYTYSVAEDQSFNFDVLPNGKDVDGDTVTLVSAKSSAGASVYVVTNDSGKSVLYYEADSAAYDNLGDGKTATDTVTYTVKDSTGLTATSTVTVTINGIKDGIVIDGGNGEDVKVGTDANETVSGFNSNDQLDGKGGADRIIGGNGDDLLRGGDGTDKLYGDRGNDTLHGERGNDFLSGGLGEDTFVFDSHIVSGTTYHGGTDTIVDFKVGVDHIKLGAGITVTNVAQALVASLDDKGNTVSDKVMDTVLTLSNGGQIQLAGINNLSDWHVLL